MPSPYFEPKSTAPILQEGLRQRAPYLAQPLGGVQAALPAVGKIADAAFEGEKKLSVQQAREVYGNYLAKVDAGKATPEDHKFGTMAALSLGLTPPANTSVSPDIWNAVQSEAGIKTTARPTKENVAATETLARLKGTTKEAARIAARDAADSKKATAEAGKQTATDDKFWSSQFKMFTPTNAARGSLIGQAAFGNARADRALTTLADPKITPQQISAVVNDYAGIMQGGVPHADAMRAMGFGTLLDDFANLKTRITSKPQEANQPEVVAKLKMMIQEIKEVDNQIIANNLDTFEQTNSGPIERNPAKWDKIKASVMRGTQEPKSSAGAGGGTASDYVRSLGLGQSQ